MPKLTIPTIDLRDDTVRQLAALLRALHPLIALLQSVQAANTVATAANTVATVQNSTSTAAGVGGEGGTGGGGGLFSSLLGGFSKMLGIASIGLNILNLFRGRRESALSLTPYQEPTPLSLEVANTRNILPGLPRVDQEAGGAPRPIATTPPPPPMQVTVNVSAIDSRSFMDYGPALAQAVRDAMLHMHPINQVVRDVF